MNPARAAGRCGEDGRGVFLLDDSLCQYIRNRLDAACASGGAVLGVRGAGGGDQYVGVVCAGDRGEDYLKEVEDGR